MTGAYPEPLNLNLMCDMPHFLHRVKSHVIKLYFQLVDFTLLLAVFLNRILNQIIEILIFYLFINLPDL
jgi:hypothetical protein